MERLLQLLYKDTPAGSPNVEITRITLDGKLDFDKIDRPHDISRDLARLQIKRESTRTSTVLGATSRNEKHPRNETLTKELILYDGGSYSRLCLCSTTSIFFFFLSCDSLFFLRTPLSRSFLFTS